MRYFKDRTEAGRLLAQEIGNKYANQNTAIVALNAGGIIIGAEIAKTLHSSLYLLPVASVLMREQAQSLSQMTTTSAFSAILNPDKYSIEEITNNAEFMLSRLEIENFLKNSPIFSREGAINKHLISRHNIIVVSDGIANGLSIALADQFFRPIATKDIIVAAPLCNADLTERVHDMTRDFYYLENIQSTFPISHYYEADDVPNSDQALQVMSTISLNW